MNEPERLSDHGSDLEVSLLRAGRADTPPPISRRRTLVALGLASGAVFTTTAASASGAGGAASTTTTIVTSSGTVAMVKWIVGGIVAGLLTVGTVSAVGVARDAGQRPSGSPPATMALAAPPLREATAPAPAAKTAAPAPAEPLSAAAPAPTAAPSAPRGATLSEEIATIDAAQKALAAGDAAGALRAADEHDRRFPGGALGAEATVVRIEAYAAQGRRDTATRMARAYLGAHPDSPHAKHLRTLLGLAPPSPVP